MCTQAIKHQPFSVSGIQTQNHALLATPMVGLCHELSSTWRSMENYRCFVAFYSKFTLLLKTCYMLCGHRRDTTTMNTSEFPSLRVFIQPHYNSPNIPCVTELGPKHVLIYLACNDTDSIIKSIMENEKLHEKCRSCLHNPKSMESRPAWIVAGITHLPKETVAVGSE